MNWNDIKIFTLVGQTGSFSAAAKQLNMDHSSISRRMRQLEKQHNINLFERDGPRVILSPEAHHLLASARQATSFAKQFERELKANENDLQGKLGFSTLYASEGRIMKALADFSRQYPDIELDIKLSQTIEDLDSNSTDVVLRVTNNPTPHFIGKRIATNHFAVYANKNFFTPDTDLSQVPWILWSSQFTDAWMAQHYPEAKCISRINTAEGVLAAIAAGMGVGHLSHLAAIRDDRLIQLLPPVEGLDIDFWLLYHQDLRGNKKVRVFVDFMLTALRNVWS